MRDTYRTTDTSLAAYLICKGYPVQATEHVDHKLAFIFHAPDPALLIAFEDGSAVANVQTYYSAYRRLVRLAKERKHG